MMNGPVKLPPDFDIQGPNAAKEWPFWKQMFSDYLLATGQDQCQDKVKLSLLRNLIGTESARTMSTLNIPDAQVNNFDFVVERITAFVSPRVNESFERLKFISRKQQEGESFEHFLTDCRQLVKSCNYNDTTGDETVEQKQLRDKIVWGISSNETREALLRIDKLTLTKAEALCRASEQSKQQSKEFRESGENSESSVQFVRKKSSGKKNGKASSSNKSHDSKSETFKCRRCQTEHGPRQCPAFGKECKRCGLKNHFQAACKVKNVRNVSQESDEGGDSEGSVLFAYSIKCKSNTAKKHDIKAEDKKPNVWGVKILIEDKSVMSKIDTGADVSIMPLDVFKKVNKQFRIRPTGVTLKGFEGSQAKPIGVVNLCCVHKNNEVYEDFYVIDGNAPVLLSGKVSINLGLISRVFQVQTEEKSDKQKFIEKYPEIFEGHGKFPGQYTITTKPDFKPMSKVPVRLPLTVREPLKKELDRLVNRNAMAKVDKLQPNASVNRLVIVEKPSGAIRLCMDPSDLNPYIIRNPRVVKTVDEINPKLKDKKYFSVFDLSEGYHQLELDEESSWKCCVATPHGIFRFKVLPYGLVNSQDLFAEAVEKTFGELKNTDACHDDIIVYGETEKEHDDAVLNVVKQAKAAGVKFNKNKLQYKQDQVRFMGQIFSSKGMSIDPDRIESIVNLRQPAEKQELQRVLGSFNYVRRYVPSMGANMKPLCDLLKKENDWHWLPAHSEAFSNLKKTVSSSPALCPFDPTKIIILQCDASKNGIGCCMFQEYDKMLKLVSCASRCMNDREIGYSQTEKELLAIHYATQKFHHFIYGREVLVQTDHKPLIPIMDKNIHKIGSVRLQRLRLKMLKYNLKVYYVPGKFVHFADMLSRSSLPHTEEDPEMSEMVHVVSKHLPMSKERVKLFRQAVSNDSVLNELSKYYYEGWPSINNVSRECKPYYPLRHDVYVEAGLMFVQDKIIVPQSMRGYVLKLLHTGHPGLSKSCNKARQLFYWPGMTGDIDDNVRACRTCEKFMPSKYKEPLKPHEVPSLRYNKVGADILELSGKAYLVIVDYLSHWIELIPMPNKDSKSVIHAMQDVFMRWGFPETIIVDNMPFLSFECKKYYKTKDITPSSSSPHYHRSNGLAEKAVGICKKILRKGFEDKKDYRDLLLEYNTFPINGLEASPAEILQSRQLRTRLPITSSKLEPKINTKAYKALCEWQSKVKARHDIHARSQEREYDVGEEIVTKLNSEKTWEKL